MSRWSAPCLVLCLASQLRTLVGQQVGLTRCSVPCAGCESLAALPKSVGQLSNLRELDLTGCCSLRRMPDTIGALQHLTNLQMPQCTSLRALHEGVASLASLATLNAGNSCSLWL